MKAILYKKDTSVNWYVQLSYYDENNKRKLKSIKTDIPVKGNNKRKAEEKRKQILKEYEEKFEKQNINPFSGDILFSDYIKSWVQSQKNHVETNTLEGYNVNINKHIYPYFSKINVLITDLQPIHIQNYYTDKLQEGLSPNTIKHHHSNIRKCLQDALYQNTIPFNPADRVKLPKIEKFRANFYNQEQVHKLMDCIKGSTIETVILLCVYYGLRRSEAVGLKWKYVDFINKNITIGATVTRLKTTVEKERTKNKSSYRTLPLIKPMEDYLIQLKQKQEENKNLLGNGYIDSDYVCTWNNGKILSPDYVSKTFKSILEKNNLEIIRLHDLRHTCASMLSNLGYDIKMIQEYLGHSSIDTTANLYAHIEYRSKINMTSSIEKAINNIC